MTMNRRQFLRLAAAAPVVAKAAPLLPAAAPRVDWGELTVGPPILRIPNIDASKLRPNVFYINWKTYQILKQLGVDLEGRSFSRIPGARLSAL